MEFDLKLEENVSKNLKIHIVERSLQKAHIHKLHNGRLCVRLDIMIVWNMLKDWLRKKPIYPEIERIVGSRARLIKVEVVWNTNRKRNQTMHRDHRSGYGKVATLAIDLDGNSLCTWIYESQAGIYDADGRQIASDMFIYDSFSIHAGPGLLSHPIIDQCKNRMFLEFADIDNPSFDNIINELGGRRLKIYPPTLSSQY